MITKSLKQIAFATIGTSCIALGIVTEAQAAVFSGSIQINGFEFKTTDDGFQIDQEGMAYTGAGDFDFLGGGFIGIGEVDTMEVLVPGAMDIESFFVFSDDSLSFTLESIKQLDAEAPGVEYMFTGTIEDDGDITKMTGALTSQLIGDPDEGYSWSVSMESETVPEPTTILGLGVVAVASAFGLKKKNS